MTHQDRTSESVFKDEGADALSPARFARALGISEPELAEALRVDLDTLQQRPDDQSIGRSPTCSKPCWGCSQTPDWQLST